MTTGKPSKLEDTSNVDWAPTVNMGHSNIKDTTKRTERDKRASKRALNPKQPSKKASKRPKVKHLDAEVVLISVQATNIETPPSCSGFLNEGNSDDLPLLSQDDPGKDFLSRIMFAELISNTCKLANFVNIMKIVVTYL